MARDNVNGEVHHKSKVQEVVTSDISIIGMINQQYLALRRRYVTLNRVRSIYWPGSEVSHPSTFSPTKSLTVHLLAVAIGCLVIEPQPS